jgi:AcrR family transcriptional regulator
MTSAGGAGARGSKKLQAILDGTTALMLDQGYGAVTFRSVATAAGVAAGLVQYYFPSLDDLFVAVLRQGTDKTIEELTAASRSDQPLRSVWEYSRNPTGAAMLMEFMALANHRPAVGEAIGAGGERVRKAVLKAISRKWSDYGLDRDRLPPAAVLFLLSAVPRMAHLEDSLGTSTGHAETFALIEEFLDRVEPRG